MRSVINFVTFDDVFVDKILEAMQSHK